MKLSRVLLACLLSLSIPATTLAAVVSQAQCEHMQALTSISDTASHEHAMPEHAMHEHNGHAMDRAPGDHRGHTVGSDSDQPSNLKPCSHCNTGQCASGSTGTFASGSPLLTLSFVLDSELRIPPGEHTAAAHSSELLRPPSLI